MYTCLILRPSCPCVVMSNSDQGIWTSGMLEINLRTWLWIFHVVICECKSSWPLQQCACNFFFSTQVHKMKRFLLFLFYLSLNWMPWWNVSGLSQHFSTARTVLDGKVNPEEAQWINGASKWPLADILICNITHLISTLSGSVIYLQGLIMAALWACLFEVFAPCSPLFAVCWICWVEVRGSQCHVSGNISCLHSLSLLVCLEIFSVARLGSQGYTRVGVKAQGAESQNCIFGEITCTTASSLWKRPAQQGNITNTENNVDSKFWLHQLTVSPKGESSQTAAALSLNFFFLQTCALTVF